jgi:hypothetical protein
MHLSICIGRCRKRCGGGKENSHQAHLEQYIHNNCVTQQRHNRRDSVMAGFLLRLAQSSSLVPVLTRLTMRHPSSFPLDGFCCPYVWLLSLVIYRKPRVLTTVGQRWADYCTSIAILALSMGAVLQDLWQRRGKTLQWLTANPQMPLDCILGQLPPDSTRRAENSFSRRRRFILGRPPGKDNQCQGTSLDMWLLMLLGCQCGPNVDFTSKSPDRCADRHS